MPNPVTGRFTQPRAYATGRPGPADRPALPPGSPETWGAITAGTLLDGAEYPVRGDVMGKKEGAAGE